MGDREEVDSAGIHRCKENAISGFGGIKQGAEIIYRSF